MKITRFTIVVSLMAVLAVFVALWFINIEGWKAAVFIIPLLFTVYFYRKRVCYVCGHQDCPFHFKSRGNMKGFWLPIVVFFMVGSAILFLYNYLI